MGTPVRLAIGFMEVPPPLVEELSPSWGSHGRVEWGWGCRGESELEPTVLGDA